MSDLGLHCLPLINTSTGSKIRLVRILEYGKELRCPNIRVKRITKKDLHFLLCHNCVVYDKKIKMDQELNCVARLL